MTRRSCVPAWNISVLRRLFGQALKIVEELPMKKAFLSIALLGAMLVVSSAADARCVTERRGTRSTTNCDGVITERDGNRSITYNRDGSVTRRKGNRSTTYGDGVTTYRRGDSSTTYDNRPGWRW